LTQAQVRGDDFARKELREEGELVVHLPEGGLCAEEVRCLESKGEGLDGLTACRFHDVKHIVGRTSVEAAPMTGVWRSRCCLGSSISMMLPGSITA